MQTKSFWGWSYTGPKGSFEGYVEAVDPRDALSRTLTRETGAGRLFGEEHGVPVAVLREAPGNADASLDVAGQGFRIRLRKVACPSEGRHADDVAGCGSENVSGPDHEGFFDCHACGVFFNPRTAS